MTPPRDCCTGYDSFWTEPAPTGSTPPAPADAYDAFLAAVDADA